MNKSCFERESKLVVQSELLANNSRLSHDFEIYQYSDPLAQLSLGLVKTLVLPPNPSNYLFLKMSFVIALLVTRQIAKIDFRK